MRRLIATVALTVCWGCVLSAGVPIAEAQATGELTGVVRDATAAPVPGATVTVQGTTPGAPLTIEADGQGRFGLRLLPGIYQVTVTAVGFDAWTASVDLSPGGVRLDISLQVALSDRVTVTATRTGMADIQTTGLSITAVEADGLDQALVGRIEHLAPLVPTLSISQSPSGTPLLTLRGIGSNSGVPGAEPNVAMQLDGVYLARGHSMGLDFLDVERVEVLRGPQGTLFGRNSMGGTINIVTRQPTNALETRVRLTAGTYDTLRAEGAISGPLIKDRVMGSFAILRASRDGFVAHADRPGRSLGTEDTWAGRGQLRIVFRARHELLVSGDLSSARGVPLTLARPHARNPNGPSVGFDIPGDFWSVRPDEDAEGRNTQGGGSARLTVRLGEATTLTSLTAYRDADFRLFVDSDTTERRLAATRLSDAQRQISQEVTLARRSAGLTWTGGAFWFGEHIRAPFELTLFEAGIRRRAHATIDTTAWALFGQVRYPLAPRVAVTGGIRYSHEREQALSSGERFHLPTARVVGMEVLDAEAADSAWTPKGSLEMEASRDTFLFLSAARGFKSGGINLTASSAAIAAFRPELAWSYEAGLKRTLPGGRGRVNASVFYVDYRDLQVVTFVGEGIYDVSNAGRATSKGVELEATVSAGRGLQLRGLVAWLDAAYGHYTAVERGAAGPDGPVRIPIDATGKRLREAPRYSGSGSAMYEFPPAAVGAVSLRADVSWQSRVFFTPSNTPLQSQPAYALVHARAAFAPRSRRWEASVYVRNLGRQEYLTATWEAAGDVAISGRPGEPRHWGTQFTIRR